MGFMIFITVPDRVKVVRTGQLDCKRPDNQNRDTTSNVGYKESKSCVYTLRAKKIKQPLAVLLMFGRTVSCLPV